jgi:hypothetical protein
MAAAAAHRANETAERFSVVYSVHGRDEADARERTTALCLEQTVELPAKLVQDDPFLWNEVVGQLEHFQVPAPPPIRRSSAADDERRPGHADNEAPLRRVGRGRARWRVAARRRWDLGGGALHVSYVHARQGGERRRRAIDVPTRLVA